MKRWLKCVVSWFNEQCCAVISHAHGFAILFRFDHVHSTQATRDLSIHQRLLCQVKWKLQNRLISEFGLDVVFVETVVKLLRYFKKVFVVSYKPIGIFFKQIYSVPPQFILFTPPISVLLSLEFIPTVFILEC